LPTDVPVADLGPELLALLLRSFLWLAVVALVVSVATQVLVTRSNPTVIRLQQVLLGPADGPPEYPARRLLRISIGTLWIIDGLLQAQPHMPAGFVADTLSPGIASSPSWLGDIINPLAQLWTNHPVTADATTVGIQVGIGLLILTTARGRLSPIVLWASIAWSVGVWVAGEFLGGLVFPGASWLTGSPGAVLVYAIAALLLLAPPAWWECGRSAKLARRSVAAWMLLGAALQALPWEGSWSADGLSEPFAQGAAVRQPSLLRQPIVEMTTLSRSHPVTTNVILIVLLAVVAVGLWTTSRTEFLIAGLALCAATWWLAQDFGVLGGMGTDPNAALPLGVLLVCGSPTRRSRTATPARSRESSTRAWRIRAPAAAGFTALGVGAALIAPFVAIGILVGPADASAVTADSGGGVLNIPHRAAPAFALIDQNNRRVSLSSLRGRLTLVTFLDPVCSDDCPIVANQLAAADRELGGLSDQVQIVAIDSNPLFNNVSDVAAFTTSHGLASLSNWHFLAGPASTLQDVAAAYGVAVQVPTVGMIEHSDGIYFLAADGSEEAYLGDGADASLTTSYAEVVRDEIRRLLS
jgi:cytochrome oxidase Cu insertion factor (SCO1/SenC/PrrC family)